MWGARARFAILCALAACATNTFTVAPTKPSVLATRPPVEREPARTVVVLTPLDIRRLVAANARPDDSLDEAVAAACERTLVDAGWVPLSHALPPDAQKKFAAEWGSRLRPASNDEIGLALARAVNAEAALVVRDAVLAPAPLGEACTDEARRVVGLTVAAGLIRAKSGELLWNGAIHARSTDLLGGPATVTLEPGLEGNRCVATPSFARVSCRRDGDACADDPDFRELQSSLVDGALRQLLGAIHLRSED